MNASEICTEEIFVTFPWWLEKVKSRSKIALFFSNERHFEIWFQKNEQLRFSEVNYLNYTKKTQFLHVATTFSLKQGETKTSHGPIPHPLSMLRLLSWVFDTNRVCHVCCNFWSGYMCRTTVIFGTLKDSSLKINSSAFQLQKRLTKWRQHFVKNGFKKLVFLLSKSSKFRVVWTIQFYSNFTSMWSKYLSNNVWRDFRLPMSA